MMDVLHVSGRHTPPSEKSRSVHGSLAVTARPTNNHANSNRLRRHRGVNAAPSPPTACRPCGLLRWRGLLNHFRRQVLKIAI